MASRLTGSTYEIFNEKAEPIGEVRQPLSPGLIGIGRGTVYLERKIPGLDTGGR